MRFVFTLRSHAAIIYFGVLGLMVRVSFGVRVGVSKLLGSNDNPTPSPNITLTLTITLNLP